MAMGMMIKRECPELKIMEYERERPFCEEVRSMMGRFRVSIIGHIRDTELLMDERRGKVMAACAGLSDVYVHTDGCLAPYPNGGDIASSIAYIIRDKEDLMALFIGRCMIGNAGATVIASALSDNTKLRKLTFLCDTSVTAEGTAALAAAVKGSSSLRHLSIRWGRVGVNGIKALGDMLDGNTALLSLSLLGTEIGDEGAKVLFDSLDVNRALQDLYLEQCSISLAGIGMLASGIMRNDALRTLVLADNDIGDEGAVALANVIAHGISAIEVLDLEGCSIGPEGVSALADAIAGNTTMVDLSLGRSTIGDMGAMALERMLKQNETLKILDLCAVQLTHSEVKPLASGIKQNSSLMTMKLDSCHLGYESIDVLADALESNMLLTGLGKCYDGDGLHATARFIALLERNEKLVASSRTVKGIPSS